jgi:hypothetical protein
MGKPGYAYFGSYIDPPAISKIKLSDFTLNANLTLTAGETGITAMAIDRLNQIIYVGLNTIPGSIAKIRISDFSRIGTLTFGAGETPVNSMGINQSTQKLFFGCFDDPVRVRRVDLATFAIDQNIYFPAGRDYAGVSMLDNPHGLIYFVTEKRATPTGPTILMKYSQYTSDYLDDIQISTEPNYLWTPLIFGKGAYCILVSFDGTDYWLATLNTEDFSTREAVPSPFPAGDTIIGAMAEKKGIATFGDSHSPANIYFIQLTPLGLLKKITLTAGEDIAMSAVYDSPKGFAYYGLGTTPGIISKIDATLQTEAASINIGSGTALLVAAVIEPTGMLDYLPIMKMH